MDPSKTFRRFGSFGACAQMALETRLYVMNAGRGRVNQIVAAEMLSEIVADQYVMLARMQRQLDRQNGD